MSGFDVIGSRGNPPAKLVGEGTLQRQVAGSGDSGGGFDTLLDAVGEANRLAKDTKRKAEAIARGEPVEVHEVMIAGGKSEVAFNLMLEVRNKLIDAWERLSRSVV